MRLSTTYRPPRDRQRIPFTANRRQYASHFSISINSGKKRYESIDKTALESENSATIIKSNYLDARPDGKARSKEERTKD
jgi:hypothetical protein